MAIVTIVVTALLMIIFSLLFAYYKFIKLRRVIAEDEEGLEHQGSSREPLPVVLHVDANGTVHPLTK
jgi:cell division protein FtsL